MVNQIKIPSELLSRQKKKKKRKRLLKPENAQRWRLEVCFTQERKIKIFNNSIEDCGLAGYSLGKKKPVI